MFYRETCDCCGKFDRVQLFFFDDMGVKPRYVCLNCPSPTEDLYDPTQAIDVVVRQGDSVLPVYRGNEYLYSVSVDKHSGNVYVGDIDVTQYCDLMPVVVQEAILEAM